MYMDLRQLVTASALIAKVAATDTNDGGSPVCSSSSSDRSLDPGAATANRRDDTVRQR